MSNDPCPICGGSGCKTYPLMIERYLAGRDREHWRRIHDRRNGGAEYPPLLTQAGNAIRAAVGFARSGGATVDESERSRRLAICRECPHFDAKQGRCKICGCFANLKARMRSGPCPDNRW